MYNDARIQDLGIPEEKYYLADTGIPTCKGVMVPCVSIYHMTLKGRIPAATHNLIACHDPRDTDLSEEEYEDPQPVYMLDRVTD
jgi:hypothetical protein